MQLGVCYYPEHWPDSKWEGDARRMADMGIARVRIAEFAWSRIEPEPGRYAWGWLDDAVETLARHGLQMIMGTPTASPPKWLVDLHPDMLPVARDGSVMQFGSRRHYDISSVVYREHCARIVEEMARRYGAHPSVVAWQTDNEFGCHNTLPSYTQAALYRFRRWLAGRYETIGALNAAWGNVFWSMEYRSFDEIELPYRTPTDANPAHGLDFRRFPEPPVRPIRETGPFTLLSVGRLVPKKGFDGLLQALARLPADLDWRLRHVGGGLLRDELTAEAAGLGIGDRIDWLGARPQEQVLEEYRGADLFVLNCRIAEDGDRDGLPNVLMEAQSQRLPVISTAMPAIAELVIDGETGVLSPPDDPERLAEAIARLLRDPALRAQYAGAGFRRMRSLFSAASGIDDLERRFREDLPASRIAAPDAFEASDSG